MLRKACWNCHKVKPITDFYKVRSARDGHFGKCKKCCNIDNKKHLELKKYMQKLNSQEKR